MISATLACKIREATYLYFNWKHSFFQLRAEQSRRRERGVGGDGVRAGKERDLTLSQQSVSDALYLLFATSRIYKKHVQLGHADGCRGNKHGKRQPIVCPRLMRISYMKSILGALGIWGPRQLPTFA